jgi:hypothetical protein
VCACHHDVHIEAPSLVSDELNQTFPVSTCSNFTNDTIAENIISKCNSSSVENEMQRKRLVELVRNMRANLVPAALATFDLKFHFPINCMLNLIQKVLDSNPKAHNPDVIPHTLESHNAKDGRSKAGFIKRYSV